MDRPLLALFSLHVVISVFGLTGCIISGLNFGNSYPALITNSVESLSHPVETEQDMRNSTNTTYKYIIAGEWRDYHAKVTARASFRYDPRSLVLPVFMATTMVSSALAVIILVLKDKVFLSSLLINYDFALFVVHFSYLVAMLTTNSWYVHDDLQLNWSAAIPATTGLHSAMLVLTFSVIVLSGWCLRKKGGPWPRCNCLQMPTLGTAVVTVRIVLLAVALRIISAGLGSGMYISFKESIVLPYCSNHYSCGGQLAFPSPLYFAPVAMLLVTFVIAMENYLSRLWGKSDHLITVIGAIVSGVLMFITGTMVTPVAVRKYQGILHGSCVFCLLICSVCFLQALIMWCCPDFWNSPPNVYALLCGNKAGKKQGENDGGEISEHNMEASYEDGTRTSEDNTGVFGGRGGAGDGFGGAGGEGEASTSSPLQENGAGGNTTDAENVFTSGQCLTMNIVIVVLGITSAVLLAVKMEYSPAVMWAFVLLTGAVTAVIARAVTAIVTLVLTRKPPQVSSLQLVIELGLELLVVLVTVVGSMAWRIDILTVTGGCTALMAVVVKIIGVSKLSPFKRALQLIIDTNAPPNSLSHAPFASQDDDDVSVTSPS